MSAVFEVLYYLFLFPLEQLMTWCLQLSYRLSGSYGLATVMLGLAVNLAMIPVYRVANRWKAAEKRAREAMAWELESINAHSSGWEKYYYRKAWWKIWQLRRLFDKPFY